MKNLSFFLVFLNLIFYAGEIPIAMLIYSWGVFCVGVFFFRKFRIALKPKIIRRLVSTLLLVCGVVLITKNFKPLLTVESALSLLLLLLVLKLYELENYEDYFHFFLITVLAQSGILLLNPTFFSLVFSLFNIILTFIFVIKINQYQLGSVNLKRLLLYLLPAIPLCFLLFFFFPRFTSGFIRLQEQSAVTSGMNSEINFMNLGPLNLDAKTIFKVNLKEDYKLSLPQLYWRTTVLWDTDGENWTEGHYSLKINRQLTTPALIDKLIHYQLVLEDLNQLAIPLLEQPAAVDLDTYKFDSFRDQTFQFKHQMYSKKLVQASSNLAYISSDFDKFIGKKSLRVKKNSFPRLKNFLSALYKDIGKDDQKQKLVLLKQYFNSGGFQYSLNPPPYNSVEDFILDSKTGYCSHFASSFALLARLSGIPARVVNGFQGGIYNELGNFYTIEAKDAHAWVEIYDKNLGWTRVDPTELVYPVRINLGARATIDQLNPYLQFANIKINRKSLDIIWINKISVLTSMINNNLSTWFYEFDQDYQKFLTEKIGLKTKNLPLFLVVVFCFLLGVFYLIMRSYQKQRQFDKEVKEYLKFVKKMENLGLAKYSYEGPLHFKQRCLQEFPEMADQIENTINLFIKKRYEN